MKKRKIPKTSKRRLLFFGTLSIIIIGYSIFTIIYYSANIFRVETTNTNLKNNLETLQNKEEVLKIEIQKLKDPEYLARYARENYSYSKDGEYIIKIDSQEQEQEIKIAENNSYIYIIIICVGVAIVTLMIFTRKKKTVE